MDELGERIADRIRLGEEAGRRLGNVETHNPHFVGRTSEMRRIHESVMLGRMGVLTAVHGMGGVGKTALATEYAHAFAAGYGGGRWLLRCEGREDLPGAIALLAAPLGVTFTEPEKYDVTLQYQRVIAELRRLAMENEPHHALLLLDNVDRPKLLEPAQTGQLPDGDWLHLLATTRLTEKELHKEENEALSDRVFVAVDELPEEDALSLIESHQRGGRFRDAAERDAAREIVRLLGGFTLAVEEAAVYLGRYPEVTCAAFLARLRKEGLEGLDNAAGQSGAGVRHGEIRLGATLRPMLERLSAAERLVMDYAALLPPDHVALPWLRELAAAAHPELGRDAEPGYPDPWRDVLRRLMGLRLLLPAGAPDADGQPRLVRVHRLVQQLVGRDAPPELRAARQVALDALVKARVAVLNKTTAWTEARWEVLPLDVLANLWGDTEHPGASWLMNDVGVYWKTLAEWSRAEPLMRRALAIDEAAFGPDHPKVVKSLSNLAQFLQDTYWMKAAEPLMRRALAIDEATYGPEHPEVAIRLSNLAELLYAMNRLAELAEAEPLMRRALAIDEAAYGPEHPHVARDLNNLAQLLKKTKRPIEAEKLMRRALAIDEAAYGPEHPKVARDLNKLALLLKDTNRLAEAEKLMRHSLAIDEAAYGPEHPHVATDLIDLAWLLHATNRVAEAEKLMGRALDMFESEDE
jgi:tetratricopeptide (TPR) repeat protein